MKRLMATLLALSAGALAALRWSLYGEAKRLYSFSLAEPDLKELGDAAETYVHTTLERGFGTLDFYKGLFPSAGTDGMRPRGNAAGSDCRGG